MITMIDFWKRFEAQMNALSLTKKEIAAMSGINYSSFIGYATKGRLPKTEEAVKIAKVLGTSVEYLVSGEEPDSEECTQVINLPSGQAIAPVFDEEPTVLVPIVSQRISAGHGEDFLTDSQYKGHVRILERMTRGVDRSSLIAATVKGDSMTGVQIFDGDLVIFAHEHISENGLYVISLYGEVKVKRLEFRAVDQMIFIHSENAKYSTETVGMENENLIILGKVVGWVHCHPY